MKREIFKNHFIEICIILLIGLYIMSLGIAFSIKAALGTSPISSGRMLQVQYQVYQ